LISLTHLSSPKARLRLLVEDRLPGWIEEPDSAAVGVAVALRFQ
jgi:hypothetical protein